jgi:hypothetical protein
LQLAQRAKKVACQYKSCVSRYSDIECLFELRTRKGSSDQCERTQVGLVLELSSQIIEPSIWGARHLYNRKYLLPKSRPLVTITPKYTFWNNRIPNSAVCCADMKCKLRFICYNEPHVQTTHDFRICTSSGSGASYCWSEFCAIYRNPAEKEAQSLFSSREE